MAVVVANMIGTGVFTSLGFQLVSIQSGFVIMMLWAVGGLAALCGALSYGELGSMWPRSGGEYHFLSKSFHPSLGFMAGWVSATVGFAAPIALAALAFGAYVSSIFPNWPSWSGRALGASLLLLLAAVHGTTHRNSGLFQLAMTIIKISVIGGFCIAIFFLLPDQQPIRFLPQAGDMGLMGSGAFAVSLIYVGYAYTGWNAATYVTGELENPQKHLPRILTVGILIVILLYLGLNASFLLAAPIDAMVGKEEIGAIAASAAFGPVAGRLVGIILAALLISTISAMTIAGPRVLQMIGEDFSFFRWFGKTNEDGVPSRAIWGQTLLALVFMLSASFDQVLVFSGFTLALVSFLSVIGLLVARWRFPDLARPFRVPLFPWVPLIYLSISTWTLVFVAINRSAEVIFAFSLLAIGGLLYLGIRRTNKGK